MNSWVGKKIAMKKKNDRFNWETTFQIYKKNLFNVCLREHIFHFFKKRFVLLFGLRLKVGILAHFFKKFPLFL